MSPTILIAGATGNTGVSVVRTLSSLVKSGKVSYRLLATTRNSNGAAAQSLAALPGVDVIEMDWTLIDAQWLRDNDVTRLFIAAAIGPTQFTDESLLFNAALDAGVKYAVRISTTKANVGPAGTPFYGRNHWALETMLADPGFKSLQWTSLQPNAFTQGVTGPMVAWLKKYKETGEKDAFKLSNDGDHGVAFIDGDEVGIIAGLLLSLADPSPHNGQKYVLVGPSNVSGKQQVALMEKYAGTTVDNVSYRDTSFVEQWKKMGVPEGLCASLALAPRSGWEGGSSVEQSPTSPEIMQLYAPRNHALQQMEGALQAV